MTNLDYLKELVNDEEKLIEEMVDRGLPTFVCQGVCDTNHCPYLDSCNEHDGDCLLGDYEHAKIWLHMEAKK